MILVYPNGTFFPSPGKVLGPFGPYGHILVDNDSPSSCVVGFRISLSIPKTSRPRSQSPTGMDHEQQGKQPSVAISLSSFCSTVDREARLTTASQLAGCIMLTLHQQGCPQCRSISYRITSHSLSVCDHDIRHCHTEGAPEPVDTKSSKTINRYAFVGLVD
jgi:hypothetical protein